MLYIQFLLKVIILLDRICVNSQEEFFLSEPKLAYNLYRTIVYTLGKTMLKVEYYNQFEYHHTDLKAKQMAYGR